MHVAKRRMMASVGFTIFGTSRSSKRTSRGPYRTAPCIIDLLTSFASFTNFRCQGLPCALAQRANLLARCAIVGRREGRLKTDLRQREQSGPVPLEIS